MSAMGFNKVLFSKVHGIVLNHGKPVSNVTVDRTCNFGATDEDINDSSITDKNGEFKFPLITRFSFLTTVLPIQPDVPQRIEIKHEGKEYLAWMFLKENYAENGELKGKPIDLICELTAEVTRNAETGVGGLCRVK